MELIIDISELRSFIDGDPYFSLMSKNKIRSILRNAVYYIYKKEDIARAERIVVIDDHHNYMIGLKNTEGPCSDLDEGI